MRLFGTHTLPGGRRVRARLPHTSDRRALRELQARLGLPDAGELEICRALRHQPRDHVAICATAWTGGREQLVGFACGDVAGTEPVVVVADEDVAPGLHDLLLRALAECGVTGLGTVAGLRVA
ncbi:MAG TPA: hypothetical protein VFT42_03720 [Solirubrobacteraceae bacterium]|nr:hypothetical protein [Solirubrobacteraceae bacterium]